ncbi:hypothetical protein ACWDA7_14085 [Streptomyces sp. NPDC001156]
MPVFIPSAPPPTTPDPEQMVVNHLISRLGYQASTERPESLTGILPYVQVTRIGGAKAVQTWQGARLFDEPRLSLDVWAADRIAATDATAAVRAAFEQMHGISRDGGLVQRTWEETGPALRPEEPNTNVVRIGLTVGLRVRPV